MIFTPSPSDARWLYIAANAIRKAARNDGEPEPAIALLFDREAVTARLSATSSDEMPPAFHDDAMPVVHTLNRTAQLLGVCRRTVDRLIESGDLQAITIISDRCVAHEDLVAFVEKRRAEATERNANRPLNSAKKPTSKGNAKTDAAGSAAA
jgi:hypothetical protein